mmetsp:Transcript_110234/g.310976  ORF Transcript_110234/g.310976 Transcript_110234/m.310976 type:complete len:226 (-) Transcript_110234:323-1000(-)
MSNRHYAAAACWTALLDSSALVHRTLRKPTSAGIIFHQRARHLLYHATKTRAAHAKFWVVMAGVGQCTARTTSAFARPVSARTAVAHAAKRGVTVTQVAPVFCSLVTTHVGPRNAKMAGVCAPRIFVKRTAVARDAVPPMMLRGLSQVQDQVPNRCACRIRAALASSLAVMPRVDQRIVLITGAYARLVFAPVRRAHAAEVHARHLQVVLVTCSVAMLREVPQNA